MVSCHGAPRSYYHDLSSNYCKVSIKVTRHAHAIDVNNQWAAESEEKLCQDFEIPSSLKRQSRGGLLQTHVLQLQ